jgi:hypothetical protein
MSDMTATDQHQLLRAIWPRWRAIATSTGNTDRPRAEQAVGRLYQFFHRPPPTIDWLHSLYRIPSDRIGPAFLVNHRETLIYSVWYKLLDPSWVCAQIGYDRHHGTFRLPANLRLLMARAYLIPRRGQQPAWLRHAGNMISQFDVDALAIFDLAGKCGLRTDRDVKELAAIISDLVESCFAAVLFDESCLLIQKPRIVMLNEAQQLSAQGNPAFETASVAKMPTQRRIGIPTTVDDALSRLAHREQQTTTFYLINGQILSINNPPEPHIGNLMWASRRMRVALIEYIGWEKFFKFMSTRNQVMSLGRDHYGNLYVIRMNDQQFLVVEVTNKTPEPNGRYRRYVIPVNSECRPLPDPNDPNDRLGEPQMLTPLNAVASTFGMTGEQYAAILGRES